MSDPTEATTATNGADAVQLSGEISRSLGTIWQHHSGARAGQTTVAINGDIVSCVRTEASGSDNEGTDEALAAGRSTGSVGYKHDAIAAVKRITHRRVMGFIVKADKKSDTVTESYVLDRPLPRS